MQPKGFMPYYENPEIEVEIDIRGRYLMMACDIEYSLLNIMAYSAPDPQNQVRRFKKMMMNQKIECTIADLKKYKSTYYDQYKDVLDELEEFRLIRNDMAHHTIEFHDNNDLTKFRTLFIDEDNGIEVMKYREYTLSFMAESVVRFRKSNKVLAELVFRLKNDYNESHKP